MDSINSAKISGVYQIEARGPLVVRDGESMFFRLQHECPSHILFDDIALRELLRFKDRIHVGFLDFIRSFRSRARAWFESQICGGGELLFADQSNNLWVDVGLTDTLEKYFRGSSYTAAFYVGLTASSPTPAAGDTMSSHSGWTENTTYSESVRQTYSPAAAASKSINNSASKAAFSINGTSTFGGSFLTTSSTKSGTSGTLLSATAFTQGNRALVSGDTLNVTSTYSLS